MFIVLVDWLPAAKNKRARQEVPGFQCCQGGSGGQSE